MNHMFVITGHDRQGGSHWADVFIALGGDKNHRRHVASFYAPHKDVAVSFASMWISAMEASAGLQDAIDAFTR